LDLGDDDAPVTATTLNISQGGCALLTDVSLETSHATIQVELILPPNDIKVTLKGQVVWFFSPKLTREAAIIVPGKLGICFNEAPHPSFMTLLAYCAKARIGASHTTPPEREAK